MQERLPKLSAGKYRLEVTNNEFVPTRKFGKMVIREFIVRESSGPEAMPVGTKAKAKPLYLTSDGVFKRIQEYVGGLLNLKPGEVTKDHVLKIFGASNPAKGKLVDVEITNEEGDNGAYLQYTWKYVAEGD